MKDDVESLAEKLSIDLGTSYDQWFTPRGYPGVACAVLDSIYSTGNHYTGVRRLVSRYVDHRKDEGADPTQDTATDLVNFIERSGGAEAFAEMTGYRWRAWSSKTAPFKAEVALDAARLLKAHEYESIASIRERLADREERENSDIARGWYRIPGQRSGLTWNYMLMLSGLPGVKADRMIRRYVTRALDRERLIGAKTASRLVEEAADALGLPHTTLDHTIWRFESKREYLKSPDFQPGQKG